MSKKKHHNPYAEPGMYVTFALLKSMAFFALSGKSPHILMDFLRKRKFDKDLVKHGNFSPVNRDRLFYTRKEAAVRGYTEKVFSRGVDQLIEVGFLDLVEQGGGMVGHASVYALSERWKKYGTPEFVPAERPKDARAFKVASMAAAREKRRAGAQSALPGAQGAAKAAPGAAVEQPPDEAGVGGCESVRGGNTNGCGCE